MNAALANTAAAGLILFDLPADEYQRRELGVASSGVLVRLLKKTPAHVKAWVEQPDEATEAKAFGQAYHCRILEPERFAALYTAPPRKAPRRPTIRQVEAKKPSSATIAAIEFWRAWDAEHAGQIILAPKDRDKIEAMAAALAENPVAFNALTGGRSEVTLRWVDEETGVPCKARLDHLKQQVAVLSEMKSVEDASPEAFKRAISNYGWHVQAAHYFEGARVCGLDLRNHLLVAQEKEYPYLAAVHQLDAAAEQRGYELRARAMNVLRDCRESGIWPGYAGITEISLPPWALKD